MSNDSHETGGQEAVVALVTGGLEALLSSWEAARAHRDEVARDSGVDLLAAYSRLRQFPPGLLPAQPMDRVRAAVEADRERLVSLLQNAHQPDVWRQALRALNAAEEQAATDEEYDALDEEALRLWCEFDDAELAVAAAWNLTDNAPPDWLPALQREMDRCFEELYEHAFLFFPILDHIRTLHEAFRKDLATFDPVLNQATLKYVTLLDEEAARFEEEALLSTVFEPVGAPSAKVVPLPARREPPKIEWARPVDLASCLAAAVAGEGAAQAPMALAFWAYDHSWKGELRIPRPVAKNAVLTLSLETRAGKSVGDGELVIVTQRAKVEQGLAKVHVGELAESLDACAHLECVPVTLFWEDRVSPGSVTVENE